MSAYVLGVDSSTQSTKVELRLTESGQVVATARAAHPPTVPPRSEQDPEAWWEALITALDEVSAYLPEVVAVSVAAQQHGLVLLGADGRPLRPAKLWNDTESAPEAAALVAGLGAGGWAGACGSVPTAAFTVTKLAWVAAHHPELLAGVERIMLPHDYLTWRLCGRHVTDRGDASGTGWWSPAAGAYDATLLERAVGATAAAELLDRLPRVLGPIEVAGTVEAHELLEWGMSPDALVAPGTGDNMAGALGLGLEGGDVAISIGTSGTVYGVSPTPTADSSGDVAGFADATGRFLPLVCTLNATKVTDAVGRLLGLDHRHLSELALEAAPGSGGLVTLPWFDGERTPNRPDATGTITGLRSDVGRAELARSAHEGVICGLLHGLDALAATGVATGGRLLLTGGGARSAAYQQVLASLAGRPVLVPEAPETVATGACVQAAAVANQELPEVVAKRWQLGHGPLVPPAACDAPAIRARYAEVAHHAAG